jgi:hypothetical protein
MEKALGDLGIAGVGLACAGVQIGEPAHRQARPGFPPESQLVARLLSLRAGERGVPVPRGIKAVECRFQPGRAENGITGA